MGWFQSLFERKRIEDSGELARQMKLFGGSKTGVTVNLQTSMRVSTAIACGRVISEGVAQTPFKMIFENRGMKEVQSKDPLHIIISRTPNQWMTAFEMLEQMTLHAVFCGNAYAYKVMDNGGNLLELLPLDPSWVRVKRREDWTLEYLVKMPAGAEQVFSPNEIWHLRGPSWDSHIGLNTISLAREALGLAIATEEYGASLFANGARPGGILTTDQTLKAEQQEQLRNDWAKAHEGAENSMKTAILSGGLKYAPLSMTSNDAQFIATRQLAVEEICRFMRVYPIMVGHAGDKTPTFASAEQMFIAHLVHTMGPWFVRIEQSAMKNLLSREQKRAGYYLKFFPNGLLRGAANDRANYYAKALGSGGSPAWMTQDEVRNLEDMNPMGGTASALPVATNVGGAPAA